MILLGTCEPRLTLSHAADTFCYRPPAGRRSYTSACARRVYRVLALSVMNPNSLASALFSSICFSRSDISARISSVAQRLRAARAFHQRVRSSTNISRSALCEWSNESSRSASGIDMESERLFVRAVRGWRDSDIFASPLKDLVRF